VSPIAGTFLRSVARISALGFVFLVLVEPGRTPVPRTTQVGDMRPVSCDAPSGLVFVKANAPTRVAGGGDADVTFTGYVETARDFCGDEARILGQRKVCGTFGCNYHTIEKSPYVEVGRSAEFTLFHDCRSGTHRYRTVVQYTAPNVRSPEKRFFVQDRQESELISC
jgi:hypothetical protein